jgi:hypothetical protein
MSATTIQELKVLRQESDWVAKQLERLQRVVAHVSSARPNQPASSQPLA